MQVAGKPRIRIGDVQDLPALAALEKNTFNDDQFSRRQFHWLLTRANGHFLVAEVHQAIVGYAIGLYRRNSRVCRCYGLAVAAQFRGGGLAQQLMAKLRMEAVRRGCVVISLEVRADNQRAINFYRRLGFQHYQGLPKYYDHGADGLRLRMVVE